MAVRSTECHPDHPCFCLRSVRGICVRTVRNVLPCLATRPCRTAARASSYHVDCAPEDRPLHPPSPVSDTSQPPRHLHGRWPRPKPFTVVVVSAAHSVSTERTLHPYVGRPRWGTRVRPSPVRAPQKRICKVIRDLASLGIDIVGIRSVTARGGRLGPCGNGDAC
jgi:hypothetical protein